MGGWLGRRIGKKRKVLTYNSYINVCPFFFPHFISLVFSFQKCDASQGGGGLRDGRGEPQSRPFSIKMHEIMIEQHLSKDKNFIQLSFSPFDTAQLCLVLSSAA